MENQTSTVDFIASFGREGVSILTFTGPLIIFAIIVLGIFLWRKRLSKKLSLSNLAHEIDRENLDHSHTTAGTQHSETPSPLSDKNPSDVPTLTARSRSSSESATSSHSDVTNSQKHDTKQLDSEHLDENTLASKGQAFSNQDLHVRDNDDQKRDLLRTAHRDMPVSSPESDKIPAKAEASLDSPPAASWLERLRRGLSKTRSQLSSSLSGLFTSKPKLDDDLLEKIHEAIYKADMGVQIADLLVDSLKNELPRGEVFELSHISSVLKQKISDIFVRSEKSENSPASGPKVILIIGVNGVGKTTTVGKLAAWHIKQNHSVLLCAADTFRAAAIEQLSIWAERVGVPIVAHKQGADPAAVAFDGVKAAKARGMDTVIIDTAGRLHNKAELMAELGKVTKVIQKEIPTAPHETWIVVDATTGQNAIQQVKAFGEVTPLTGVIVTKLDGTAKGGIVAAISHQFGLPIRYIGVGEDAEDLRPFNPQEFVASLF